MKVTRTDTGIFGAALDLASQSLEDLTIRRFRASAVRITRARLAEAVGRRRTASAAVHVTQHRRRALGRALAAGRLTLVALARLGAIRPFALGDGWLAARARRLSHEALVTDADAARGVFVLTARRAVIVVRHRALGADAGAARVLDELAARVVGIDETRAHERARIGELVALLRRQNDEFEQAATAWTDDAIQRKKDALLARGQTMLAIDLQLARLGEVGLVRELERLPYARKVLKLDAFLAEADSTYAAPSSRTSGTTARDQGRAAR